MLLHRAGFRCEYCHVPAEHSSLGLHVDHIIAQQHRGGHEEENLAMACAHCNSCKGPNIASIDPTNSRIEGLFNPRTQIWTNHFRVVGDKIVGITPTGRATVNLLGFNDRRSISRRRHLQNEGVSFT